MQNGSKKKKKRNVINLITRISVIGIASITAALIILLSAFNGIETMIERLYSEFDTDITIRASKGKTFNGSTVDYNELMRIEGIVSYSRAVEEVVILKHEKKWVNANLLGVDSSFLEISNMKMHIVDGGAFIHKNGKSFGIIGASLLDKLDAYIPQNVGHESLICYVPKRDISTKFGSSPFKTQIIQLSGRMNFNREVNSQNIIVPLDLAQELMEYSNQITAIYVDCRADINRNDVKEKIENLLGDAFIVKTNYEKNELIYKTSKSEKIIVLIILLFIFILAAFNLVASLTMLFVEKLDNIKTLISFGAQRKFIFRIFFYEGLLIAGKGILIGCLIGYSVCVAQINYGLVGMPNSGGESFPMALSLMDGLLIISLVSLLSIVFSFAPVKHLINRNISNEI